MIDTNRPTCAITATRSICASALDHRQCGAAPGSCQHQREPVSQPANSGMQPVHTSGYLQTVPTNVIPPTVPAGGLSLDDDTPLAGGACNLDGTCEACQ